MASFVRYCWVVLFCSLFSGCWKAGNLALVVDQWLFHESGGTVFSSPDRLTLKEIHLDNGTLVGRQVVVEGVVEDVSSVGTFLVIVDQSARLLVVLTDVGHLLGDLPKKTDVLQVFGTIESGKKGLPFIKAVALRLVRGPGSGNSRGADGVSSI